MTRATFTKLAAAPLVCTALLYTGVATMGQAPPPNATSKAKSVSKAVIDLNAATAEELEELRGVGEVTAKKIIAGRPYTKVEDLAKAGVPARVIESIRRQVSVGAAPTAKSTAAGKVAAASGKVAAASGKVDLNTADLAALESLPGIGPAHARAIIAGRPYKSVDDLETVKGLGKTRVDALRSLVTARVAEPPAESVGKAAAAARAARTGAATTKAMPTLRAGQKVNINTAAKEELDALPGIGPVKAQAIIEGRPFKTIEDIMNVKGIKDGEFAKIKDIITVK
jgi:competence protein ComEA